MGPTLKHPIDWAHCPICDRQLDVQLQMYDLPDLFVCPKHGYPSQEPIWHEPAKMVVEILGNALTYRMEAKPFILVHCVNDIGAWGRGFVVPLAKRWPQARSAYKREWKHHCLGDVQFVAVEQGVEVANLFGQKGIRGKSKGHGSPIRYGAIRKGLKKVAERAKATGARVQMPRMGCGLAGGEWDIMRKIVENELAGIDVTVCVV